MEKLDDIVLRKWDIVEFDNGYIKLNTNKDMGIIDFIQYISGNVKSIKRPVKFKTIYEAPHEILDKEEKEWLETFLRPFRNKVQYITKYKTEDKNGEFVYVKLAYDCVWLPYFEENTMYKGMEVNKKYTLEELGLFK